MAVTNADIDLKYISLLESTLNTRDLGGYRKQGGEKTKSLSIIRSDAVLFPSERDVDFLRENNIRTIIDMRITEDIKEAQSPFESMEGFDYYSIPMEEGSRLPDSVEDVPHSYMRIAQAENFKEIIRCISRAEGGVLYHCTAGKDRSGVVSALLLDLAGVGREDIIADYMVTKKQLEKKVPLIAKKHPEIDINIVIPHEEYMGNFLQAFHEKYKDAEKFFEAIGLSKEEMNCIKEKL